MAELCRFNGIVIMMFSGDHAPPHIHVRYAGVRARFSIADPEMLHGRLPPRIRAQVIEWASRRQPELHAAWERASRNQPPGKIAPLN